MHGSPMPIVSLFPLVALTAVVMAAGVAAAVFFYMRSVKK